MRKPLCVSHVGYEHLILDSLSVVFVYMLSSIGLIEHLISSSQHHVQYSQYHVQYYFSLSSMGLIVHVILSSMGLRVHVILCSMGLIVHAIFSGFNSTC